MNLRKKQPKTNTLLFLIKKVFKMKENPEGRKWKKILPKSRRGFKKWTKINVHFSIPQVFWRQLVLKT